MKRCSDCKQVKPLTAFRRDKRKPLGYGSYCKSCDLERRRRWRRDNPEKTREADRRWRKNNLEKAREKDRRRYRENPEKTREKNRQKHLKNPEKRRAAARRWYRNNRARAIERINRWRKANPEKSREYNSRRRSNKINTSINSLSGETWKWLVSLYEHRCAYCGNFSKDITIDHVMPLSRGGNNTLGNIVPACRSCNSLKHAKTPSEAGMTFAIEINVLKRFEQRSLFDE